MRGLPRTVVAVLLAACGGGDGGDPSDAGARRDGATATDAGRTDDAGRPRDAGGADAGDLDEDAGRAEWWRPAPGTSWQWQLTGTVDTSFDVAMYDIDLFDVPAETIAGLQADGRVVVCYFSAGSWEDWRPDADDFPAGALGNELDGWPGERWLDVRDEGVRDVMGARLDLAVEKGCDGVEPDNVDGYTNDPGFDFDADDQLEYNRFLAAEAHARGLSIGLKNDLDQVEALVSDFDWALNEQCFEYDECDRLQPFLEAGKAVFTVEYGDESLADTICPEANALGLDTLIKRLELDSWRIACR